MKSILVRKTGEQYEVLFTESKNGDYPITHFEDGVKIDRESERFQSAWRHGVEAAERMRDEGRRFQKYRGNGIGDEIKAVISLALVCAACWAARGQTNAPATLLPEGVPWTVGWDKPEGLDADEVVSFRLYSTQTFTNQVLQHATLGAVTNRVWQWGTNVLLEIKTYQTLANALAVVVPGLLARGTNAVGMKAVDAVTNESEMSEPLIIRVLGKPLAPRGVRKL